MPLLAHSTMIVLFASFFLEARPRSAVTGTSPLILDTQNPAGLEEAR